MPGHCPVAKIDAREELAANCEAPGALADEVGVNALKASHPGKMDFRLGGRPAR